MKKIQLGGHNKVKGKYRVRGYVTVDSEDYAYLNQFSWYKHHCGYALAQIEGEKVFMHRLIMGAKKGEVIDHINRNTYDNRRENLRFANKRVNSINRNTQKNNTTGYKGIHFLKKNKKFETYIWNFGKKIGLGYFSTFEEALKARKKAEIEYHVI